MRVSPGFKAGSTFSIVLALVTFATIMAFGVTSEVPVGSVVGVVTMKTSGKPLPKAEVVLYPVGNQLDDSEGQSYSTRTDKDGVFHFRSIPAGVYSIDAYGKAHHNETRAYVQVTEGETQTRNIPTDRSQNGLELYSNQRVFLPDEKPQVTVSGYTEKPNMTFQVYSVSLEQLIEKKDPSSVVNALMGDRNGWNPERTPGIKAVKDVDVPLTLKDVEGHFVEVMNLDPLPVGQYLIKASSDGNNSFTWITVSKIALVTKSFQGHVLAFVTDLKDGTPIPGAKISVAVQKASRPVAKTDGNGLAEFDIAMDEDSTSFVVVESNASRAYTWFYADSAENSDVVLFTQTDRPVYRPGDLVHYKVVARKPSGTGYVVPSGAMDVEVFDADQNKVASEHKPLSADGTIWGEFKTDAEALPGSYEIRLSYGESSDSYYVPTMTYKKPEYRVAVTALEKSLIRGQRARFKIHVETYTGEPAPGIDIDGGLYSQPEWAYNFYDNDDNDYDDSSFDDEYLGDYVDDVKGKTDENGDCLIETATDLVKGDDSRYQDEKLTLLAQVGEANTKRAEGQATVKVARGTFDLKIDVDQYVTAPGSPATFHVSASDSFTGRPTPGLKVSVERSHERWNGKKSVSIVDERKELTLDSEGKSDISFSSEDGGVIQVRATGTDPRGNIVGAEASVWNYDNRGDYEGPIADLQVILDKKAYAPGDTAKALILTAHPGGSALLTVETEGIVKKQVVDLKSKSTSIDIPNLGDLAPNGVVTVSYVKDKSYFTSEKQIRVDLTDKKLKVEVVPDSKATVPGGTVAYTVKTMTMDGRPVQSDLAVGIVDESLYAIQEDRSDPLSTFYPRRWTRVQTTYSFPVVYLDGEDKTPKSVQIRRIFEDTAGWFPNVHTDASGTARVQLRMPDNLTEWRATATAVSRDTRVGKGTGQVVSKKDLMVRLNLPAFMVEGDKQTVTARISNTTDRELNLKVTFFGTDVKSTGKASQDLRLVPQSTTMLSWDVTAEELGTAKFKVAAWEPSGSLSDGVEQTVPVVVHGQTVVSTQTGVTQSTKDLEFEGSGDSVSQEMTLTTSTTLLGNLLDSLPNLVDYPYGCTEQTMSRFLPAVLVSGVMDAVGLKDQELTGKVADVTHKSLLRLRKLQSSEGGWGWWEYDRPDPFLTAYVLEGFWRMKPLGVEPPGQMVSRGLEWSEKELKRALPLFAKAQAFEQDNWLQLACAVSLHKESPDAAALLASVKEVKKLSTPVLSLIVVSSKERGLSSPLAKSAYDEVMSRKEETKDSCHWAETYGYESTGAAWEAVVAVDPQSPLSEKIARYLFSAQKNGQMWSSTRDTARILVSATKYLRQTHDVGGSVTVAVTLNGSPVQTLSLQGTTVSTIKVPEGLLRKGTNTVGLNLTGQGKLYYSCNFVQQTRQATFRAENAPDFTLKREFFTLSTQRLQDGTLRRMPTTTPVHSARSGEVLACRITIVPNSTVSQFICEVPIPSNMRIVDEEEPLDGSTWQWWWSRSVFTERKAVFFGSVDPGGPKIVEFAVRAEAPGLCEALPGTMYRMYQPDQRAVTDGYVMEVRPK